MGLYEVWASLGKWWFREVFWKPSWQSMHKCDMLANLRMYLRQ